jgi:hypothetical protein
MEDVNEVVVIGEQREPIGTLEQPVQTFAADYNLVGLFFDDGPAPYGSGERAGEKSQRFMTLLGAR